MVLPVAMKDKLVTPRRLTYWYGTPANDDRFNYPNCPSYTLRGAYGFPNIEGRGFKVAPSFDSIPFDPDTASTVSSSSIDTRRWRTSGSSGSGSGHGYKHGIMLGDYAAHRVVDQDHSPELAETFKLKEETF